MKSTLILGVCNDELRQMDLMSLRLPLCVACLVYSVTLCHTLASDFDERVQRYNDAMQDYIYDRLDWYEDGRPKIAATIRSLKDTISFSMDNKTCTFRERSRRYSDNDGAFVYVNGEDVPQDAISFAGVFDVNDDLEMAVFRGMYHSTYFIFFFRPCPLTMKIDSF